jgi:hypothetical protein
LGSLLADLDAGLPSAASLGLGVEAGNPYGSLSMSPEEAAKAELAGSLAPIGSAPTGLSQESLANLAAQNATLGSLLADLDAGLPSAASLGLGVDAGNPYGSLTMSPEEAAKAELAGSLAPIGSTPTTAAQTGLSQQSLDALDAQNADLDATLSGITAGLNANDLDANYAGMLSGTSVANQDFGLTGVTQDAMNLSGITSGVPSSFTQGAITDTSKGELGSRDVAGYMDQTITDARNAGVSEEDDLAQNLLGPTVTDVPTELSIQLGFMGLSKADIYDIVHGNNTIENVIANMNTPSVTFHMGQTPGAVVGKSSIDLPGVALKSDTPINVDLVTEEEAAKEAAKTTATNTAANTTATTAAANGLSPGALSSLANQNVAASTALDAVSAGLPGTTGSTSFGTSAAYGPGQTGEFGLSGPTSSLQESVNSFNPANSAAQFAGSNVGVDAKAAAQDAYNQAYDATVAGQIGRGEAFTAEGIAAAQTAGKTAADAAYLSATNATSSQISNLTDAQISANLASGKAAGEAPSVSTVGDVAVSNAASGVTDAAKSTNSATGATTQASTAPASTTSATDLGAPVNVSTLNTINYGSTPSTSTTSTGTGASTGAATGATTGAGPGETAASATGYDKAASTYTGIAAIDNKINNALANPGTTLTNAAVGLVPIVGPLNSISGLLGGPTVGGVLADVAGSLIGSGGTGSGQTGDGTGAGGTDAGSTTTTSTTPPTQDSLSGGGNDSGGTDTLPGGGTDTLPGGGTVITPKTRIISGREYVGGVTPAKTYGSRGETLFFRPFQKEVTAADGGYFDADSYFSDGGLTTPSNPPSMPTMSSFPTMAFTDGQGPVGNIAQPPGLLPSDAVGSDAPHASPMAPSPAAAAPSMSTLQQTLGARNTNASPAMAPVPQNPNVGYALGQSPLSNLRNS